MRVGDGAVAGGGAGASLCCVGEGSGAWVIIASPLLPSRCVSNGNRVVDSAGRASSGAAWDGMGCRGRRWNMTSVDRTGQPSFPRRACDAEPARNNNNNYYYYHYYKAQHSKVQHSSSGDAAPRA